MRFECIRVLGSQWFFLYYFLFNFYSEFLRDRLFLWTYLTLSEPRYCVRLFCLIYHNCGLLHKKSICKGQNGFCIVVTILAKCHTSVKCNLNYVYICSWVPTPWKPVFKSEFYLKFVTFGIRVVTTVKYGIERSSSGMESNKLRL